MNVRTLPKKIVSRQKEARDWRLETGPPSPQAPSPKPQASVIVGRDTELTQLHNALVKAMSGERQIVFVAGEAGIGKTTLVDAFLAQLHDRIDVRISSGQCIEQYGPGEAYMPLLEAIAQLCRGPSRERRIADLTRYAPSLLVQLPGLLDPMEGARLQEQLQGASRERMLREMAQAAELFTTRRGLVLVLEDLHWSDVSTLEWLSYIARRREPAKLLILGTYRPTETTNNNHPLRGTVKELLARRHCEELRVTPLSEHAIAEYLYSRFGEMALPQAAAATLVRRTGGNPLFVVNTIDYFVQHGAVTREAGQWTLQLDKLNEVGQGIPDTLRQLIERQVERLSEAEQHLLEVASVAGVEFSTVDVAAGLGTTADDVEARCERFARAGQWLRLVGISELPDGAVSGRYSFLHAMYHEVIYDRIAEIRRIQLHRRIATNKEAAYGERVGEIAAELAVHFEKGRNFTRTISYLVKAGETAARRSAHHEATAYLKRGLELLAMLPQTPERAQHELPLHLTLIESLIATRGYGALEVERACARARELCQQGGEPQQLLLALWGLSGFYLTRAELQTARELGEQLLGLAHSAPDPTLLQAAHLALGQALFHAGELARAHAHLEQSTVFYDHRTHLSPAVQNMRDPGVASLCYEAWNLWLLGYVEQAQKRIHDAFSLAQELARPIEVAWALSYASGLHFFCRKPQVAQEHAEDVIQLSTECDFPFWGAMGALMRGWALAIQGRAEEGVVQMSQGLATWRALGAVVGQPGFLAMLAEAQSEAGRIEEGLHTLAEAIALVAKTGEHYYEAEVYRLKGTLTLEARRLRLETSSSSPSASSLQPLVSEDVFREAEGYFLKAIAIAQEQQAKSLELRAATSLARLWLRQGKNDDARTLLQDIYDWFTEGFDTRDLQNAAALLKELGGDAESQKSKGKSQRAKVGIEGRESLQATETESEQQEGRNLVAQSPSRLSSSIADSPIPRFPHSSSQSLIPNPQSPTPNLFRPEGEYWTISFAGRTCRFKDTRGLHYIAYLLQQPHQEIHVIALVTNSAYLSEELTDAPSFHDPSQPYDHTESFSAAGEILDPQGRAAYKQRLSELREELAEAQRFQDVGRSEHLTAKIDVLTHELTSAIGLGGRMRQANSPVERARIAVTKAVKKVLKKLHTHHPALGQHLAITIKTGAYCSYTPDPRLPISWEG